jgi:predicted metal-dependent hydrolase
MMSRAMIRCCEAISALFPAWEIAFVEVASFYRTKVDEHLADRLETFMAQEISHATAHKSFNRKHGLTELEKAEVEKTKVILRRPGKKIWLGTMVSIEHFAACMSRAYLDRFGDVPGRESYLFRWHAREELSHKDVAMDVWLAMGYSLEDLHKICRMNEKYVVKYITDYVKKDMKWSDWKDYLEWRLAFQLEVVIPYRAIFKDFFHPSLWDDSQYQRAA